MYKEAFCVCFNLSFKYSVMSCVILEVVNSRFEACEKVAICLEFELNRWKTL